MAWRFKLAPDNPGWDFFRWQWITFGGSIMMAPSSSTTPSSTQNGTRSCSPSFFVPPLKLG